MAKKNAEKEEMRKTQIVQAAYEVISSKGYDNFTIEDIANQAGLSKGGVLHYFKTKEDILIHLLEQIYNLIEKTIKKRIEKYRSPERKLKAIIISYAVLAKRHPAFYTVMVDFWAQISINERIRGINTKIYDRMCQEARDVIESGIEVGIFRKVDARNVAYILIAMLMNTAVQWTFTKSMYNVDHLAKSCINMAMAYLLKHERRSVERD